MNSVTVERVRLRAGGAQILGDLTLLDGAAGLVVFAHGSGSSRFSPRNRGVAARLQRRGFATLLLDLLTSAEEAADQGNRAYRFDVGLLAERLAAAADALGRRADTRHLPVGLFGASTGAAAALVAAARRPDRVRAVVSRGGRPDLAGDALAEVSAPTLLIVGGRDDAVRELNEQAAARIPDGGLEVVPGAGHLFEEPYALEQVADLAADWFGAHLC